MYVEIIAWVVLLIAFAVLEALTATLVSIWFCIGAAVSLLIASLGGSLGWQIGAFTVVSLIAMAIIRPFARRFLVKGETKTNADRILGAEGVVTEVINNLAASGQIRVLSEYWTARTEKQEEIPVNTVVRVLRIEGVKVIVAAASEERKD